MERLELRAPYSAIELSIHLVRYAFGTARLEGARVLDAGCGEGLGTRFLAQHGASEVVGLDIDRSSVEQASTLPHPGNCRFHRHDLVADSIVESHGMFDSIYCVETLEHVSDLEAALRNIHAAWNGKGDLIITLPNDPLYYGTGRSLNPHHLRSMAFLEARNVLENVLGPAKWLFGTLSSGFGIYEVGPAARDIRDTMAGLAATAKSHGIVVPASTDKLTPSEALFYVGVWPGRERAESIASATVTFPASAEYRMPDFFVAPKPVQAGYRPKLVLVADVRDWAYHNIARQISQHLGERFNIEIVFQSDFKGDPLAAMHAFLFKAKPDFIHFFWRETILNFIATPWTQTEFLRRFGLTGEQFAERLSQVAITASIYDHLFLEEADLDARRSKFGLLDGLSVSSQRLREIYVRANVHPHIPVITDGVDLDLFGPDKLTRLDEHDRELVIGWSGNSEWNSASGLDRKGFHTIIKPALERLHQEGYRVRGHFADRNVLHRPHNTMPVYYSEIDVLICASEIEGTPNPVLEAAACGVPIVTTDVGVVDQLLGPSQRRFILPERSVDALVAALKTLHDQRQLLRQLSDENLIRIRDWTWQSRMPGWMSFFKRADAARKMRSPITNAYMAMMMRMRQRIDFLEAKEKGAGSQNGAKDKDAGKIGVAVR
jgi:glycosyltransferase involved in cell wall biosynthesis